MSWTYVSVNKHKEGGNWCRENLNHNEWVAYEADRKFVFGFKDEAIAIEFALRFS